MRAAILLIPLAAASEANERGDGSMVRIALGSVFEAVAQTVCAHAAQHYGSDSDAR